MSYPTTQTNTQFRAQADTLANFQSRLQGQVLVPGDPSYEQARLAWNRSVDPHPAVIVVAASAGDIAEAVCFARRQGLGIAVQSTGHGIALPSDGAMLIVTSRLKHIRIDPQAQIAWIGAGLKWGEVLEKTQEFGLAPLLGSSPDVGVVGYTLGGGFGWLGRKHGLAADSVLSFDLVTAEGEELRASSTENPELFWGLRGGGGSFGIITGMQIKLYPAQTVYGGNLFYPVENARAVMRHYREWIRSAPEALTSSVVLMNFPPVPQLPEILRGKSFVMVRGCYAGPVEEGLVLLEYWRSWQPALIDDFKAMPFGAVASISSDPLDPMPSHGTGAWLRELSDEAIETVIRYAASPALAMVEIRHAGGAVARVKPEESAFSHRDAELLLYGVGMAPTPEAHAYLKDHLGAMMRELQPALTGGLYMNFLDGQDARERAQDGYSAEAFRRLRALKARMDPDNVFCFGFGIAPQE